MGAIRRRNGRTEVATDTYTKNGRHVILFGVSHIAEAGFWTRTNDFLAKLEAQGYAVHFERVIKDMENAPRIVPNYGLIADALGLMDQNEGLKVKSHWKNTDVTISRLLSKTTPEQIDNLVERAGKVEDQVREIMKLRDESPAQYEYFVKTMKVAMGIVPMISPALLKSGVSMLDGIDNTDIINLRNGVAFQAISRTKQDVVSVWGANHLKGIGGALVGSGHKLKYRQWHPAY